MDPVNTTDNEIPYFIQSLKPNEVYEVKVDNVYDPSKFWLTINFKERQLFENYLVHYYKEKKLPMPVYHIQKYKTCIVSRNSMYYRAVILPALLHELNKIRVFLIDYGQTVNVKIGDVFYIFKKHRSVPRFAIRSTLAGITPLNQKEVWTQTDLLKFLTLISDKQLLAKIIEVDPVEKILHTALFSLNDSTEVSVNEKMLQLGMASFGKWIYSSNDAVSKYKRKFRYMHLIPSFNALEKGTVPSSLWEQNILREVPLDLLYKPYYEYQNINSHIYDSMLQ